LITIPILSLRLYLSINFKVFWSFLGYLVFGRKEDSQLVFLLIGEVGILRFIIGYYCSQIPRLGTKFFSLLIPSLKIGPFLIYSGARKKFLNLLFP